MNRPNIKDFFPDDTTPQRINELFLAEPELYKYIQALDLYIDELEENKPTEELERETYEYISQIYLPIAKTIGELKEQIKDLPDDMEFGFLNQPRQQIAVREYSDGYKCAVFNGLGKKIAIIETMEHK